MTTVGRGPATGPRELNRAAGQVSCVYLERCTFHRDAKAITGQDAEGTAPHPSSL